MAEHVTLLSLKEVAEMLGCSEENVRGLVKTGQLPHVNVGVRNCLRVLRADLEFFIESRRKQNQPDVPPAAPKTNSVGTLKHIRLNS